MRKKTETPVATGKTMEQIMEEASDHKVTFAKVSWNKGRGPYILAFPDSCVRDYCEMNALEFKTVHAKEIKVDKLPLWECGAKTAEQINALPKIDIKATLKKAEKDKADKKAARAAKISASRKKK
jgi:hypothetical protein